jgi:hypothetical protein
VSHRLEPNAGGDDCPVCRAFDEIAVKIRSNLTDEVSAHDALELTPAFAAEKSDHRAVAVKFFLAVSLQPADYDGGTFLRWERTTACRD